MATFRKAVLAVIVKSLLRGKSLIQAILAYWINPIAIAAKEPKAQLASKRLRSIHDFLEEAEAAFLGPVSGDDLARLSSNLKKQFYERLQNHPECMLPSYSHQLPNGTEKGEFLALDVGGSTLRVALVELRGREVDLAKRSQIISMHSFHIDKSIKDLEGMAFFDWMAVKIADTLQASMKQQHSPDTAVPMSLAWSFPIKQTSLGGGLLQGMGKGFKANYGLIDHDLGDIVRDACAKRNLRVELKAIINDSSACLVSEAYVHTATRFGLILGTGFNISAYLPVDTIGRSKFGIRPEGWFDEASHVVVNTELGMFGHGILPLTRWDHQLLEHHPRPDFQPLEHFLSGMYLGEIARLCLIDAIDCTGIFGSIVPSSLRTAYALGTDTISMIQADTTSDLADSIKLFSDRHPSPHDPTPADIAALRRIASFVSVRSSALVATCVYTLWELRLETQQKYIDSLPETSPRRPAAEAEMTLSKTTVSFNGSVIENYPGYLSSCQRYLDELIDSCGRQDTGGIELVLAKESSLLGAAVSLACVQAGS
jgi:hexokinase